MWIRWIRIRIRIRNTACRHIYTYITLMKKFRVAYFQPAAFLARHAVALTKERKTQFCVFLAKGEF
jgi:hypothetical protein